MSDRDDLDRYFSVVSAHTNIFERSFVGSRATFQRLADAKILHGWTERTEGYGLVIRAAIKITIDVGDRFMFRLSGRDQDAVFTGHLTGMECEDARTIQALSTLSLNGAYLEMADQYYTFAIDGIVKMVTSQTEARFHREDGSVTINDTIEGTLRDVSEHGIGFITEEPISTKEVVDIRIYAGCGVVESKGDVMYCRKVCEKPAAYRVGVRLHPFDRLNASRWQAALKRGA